MSLWTVVSSRGVGSEAVRVLAVVIAAGIGFVLGRLVAGRGGPPLVAALALGGGAIALARSGWGFVDSSSGGPLGYGNANGALFSLVTLGALLGTASDRRWVRVGAISAALLFLAATAATGSVVAIAALVTSMFVAGAGELARRRHWAAVLGGSLVLTAIVLTIVLGARGEPNTGPETLAVRLRLWEEAIDMLISEPLDGIGAGRFHEVNTVSRDSDLSRAHSAFLQQGAEQGAVGLALIMALWLWALARCCLADRTTAAPAVGVAVLTSLGIHAAVDHILHYGAVPIGAAILLGAVTTTGSRGPARSETRD